MNEQQNIQAVRDAYEAFTRGDILKVLDALTDDVEWAAPGPPEIPYAGTFHGLDGAAEFFRILSQSDEVQKLEAQRFFADGDMVVVLGRYEARVKNTGKIVQDDFVHTFTFRSGKVAKFHEYFDTANYAKAYQPAAARAGI
jgi:hypothetical protein